MLISQEGTVIRVPVESVRTTGRNTMGVRVMNLRGADKVSSMARLVGGSNGNGNGSGVEKGGDDEWTAGQQPAGTDDWDFEDTAGEEAEDEA